MNVVSCAKCDPPLPACFMHTHLNFEVILQLTGTVRSMIGDVEYTLSPGDVVVVPPHVQHNGVSESVYTDIYFQAEELDFSEVTVVHDYDGTLLSLMNLMHRTMTEREANYKKLADSICETIVQYIKKLSSQSVRYPFVNDFKNIVYENLSNTEFHITDQITKMGFHPDYFRRCFKEETGKTPLEHLTDLRIRQAKTLLLQDTFVSVETVAYNCGFTDNLYFSTCFKKHAGISPMQYRKKNYKR